jgi:hypothetical protein
MSMKYNVAEAASWSEEEADGIIFYVTQHCRWADLEQIEELRSGEKTKKAPVEETAPDGTNESEDVPKKKSADKKK